MPNPMIGEHRRQAKPATASSAIAIPGRIVQHTVQQLVLQGHKLVSNLSHVRMFESHEAVRMGLPAFARGGEIHFAPGAFQPHTETGRQLIQQQLASLPQPAPVAFPYPDLSTSNQGAPSHSNVPTPTSPNVNSSAPPSAGPTPPAPPTMSRPMIGGHRL